uniref:Family with sequence similarity 47 member E n=2 Tax=Otolemur garnettii TaxID=30611 RepID=H0XF65_OTOGA
SKCFPKHKNRPQFPASLNSRRWVFLTKGPEDFRKGCGPCPALISRAPQEGSLPQICHRAPLLAPRKRRNQQPKDTALSSKLWSAQRVRKAFLEDVEARLAPHPLALYGNLEEAMPAELLLKVLEVLDPDRKLEDTWVYCEDPRKRMKEPPKPFKKCATQVYLGPPRKSSGSCSGQWLYKEKPCQVDLPHRDGPLVYENGSSNIDEEFILKQFHVDYQSKPSPEVLHTGRLNQLPLEPKRRVGLKKLQEPEFLQKLDKERKLQKPQNPSKPKRVKMRYGAWYLDTKLWKKQRADEPLVDPKASHEAYDENFKKRQQEQEEGLADLRGTAAFEDFILSRGYPMPSFLKKMYPRKEHKYACSKTPVRLTQA